MTWETAQTMFGWTPKLFGMSERAMTMWRRLFSGQLRRVQDGLEQDSVVRDPLLNEMIRLTLAASQRAHLGEAHCVITGEAE
jgi:hypothetical protein